MNPRFFAPLTLGLLIISISCSCSSINTCSTRSANHSALTLNHSFPCGGDALPSAETNISFFTTASIPENRFFSLMPSSVRQDSRRVRGNGVFAYPDAQMKQGTLSHDQALLLEAKLHIHEAHGTAGAFFQAFDGLHRYSVFFTAEGVTLITSPENSTIAVPAGAHTFTLLSPPGDPSFELLIDGIKHGPFKAAPDERYNGCNFGDGSLVNGGALINWYNVRCAQALTMQELKASISIHGL